MKRAASMFDFLFGCWHRHLSFPVTARKASPNRPAAARVTGTYVVCLDCGHEFPYDWEQLRIVSENEIAGRSREPAEQKSAA